MVRRRKGQKEKRVSGGRKGRRKKGVKKAGDEREPPEGKEQKITARSEKNLIYSFCFVTISINTLFQVSLTDVAHCHECC